MRTEKVRPKFREYLYSLNFNDKQIIEAWHKASEDFPNESLSVKEVVTRDILRGDYDKYLGGE